MKKNKKWFVDKWTKERNKTDVHDAMYHFINEFITDVKQLDEPEVLSQKWIKGHEQQVHPDHSSNAWWVPSDDLQTLLVPKQEITHEQVMEWLDNNDFYCHATAETVLANAVDKGELGYYGTKYSVVKKPVIPRFVAEFLIGKEDYMLYELFDDEWLYEEHDRVAKWLYDNDELTNKQREINLVMSRDRGYEVEVEQKYRVIDSHKVYLLAKEEDRNEVETVAKFVEIYGYDHAELDYNLTEQEIKDYDPRYWAFAKPVEELEE